uniref:Uncharacterized protein n=1 Tax=Arundo donax TaxID=35708 RepID=A0A0A9GCK2_ARUDO
MYPNKITWEKINKQHLEGKKNNNMKNIEKQLLRLVTEADTRVAMTQKYMLVTKNNLLLLGNIFTINSTQICEMINWN